MSAPLHHGLVVSTHGRHCVVEDESGRRLICHARGKKSEAVVGDRVAWCPTQAGSDEGVIERVEARRNLLFRQDEWRSKMFAANIDQVLVWLAVEPVFSESQLTRALIAAEAAHIPARIVLNKIDLPGAAAAWERLEPYRGMGHDVQRCALKKDRAAAVALLQPLLHERATLVLGPSGGGKSTLINALVPEAQAQTAEISTALNSGRHTTTVTRWHWLDTQHRGALIDSPGFQEFGLQHVAATDLAALMPDVAAHLGHCRFYNCTHRQEPGCGVREAAARGDISPNRMRLYESLYDELAAR
jgi:ribosome biogenesis GTPase